MFASSSYADISLSDIRSCPAAAETLNSFVGSDCPGSFNKLCRATYTDNPPFSCTIDQQPDFLTTLGMSFFGIVVYIVVLIYNGRVTLLPLHVMYAYCILGSALSNASALWALVAVLISISLRRMYPGGVLAKDYGESNYKPHYQPKNGKGSPAKYRAAGAAQVVPVSAAEEEDLENGGLGGKNSPLPPPGRMAMSDRNESAAPDSSGLPTLQDEASAKIKGGVPAEAAADGAEPPPGEEEKEKVEKDGFCEMFWDECQSC
jgi:hypothetical protein